MLYPEKEKGGNFPLLKGQSRRKVKGEKQNLPELKSNILFLSYTQLSQPFVGGTASTIETLNQQTLGFLLNNIWGGGVLKDTRTTGPAILK